MSLLGGLLIHYGVFIIALIIMHSLEMDLPQNNTLHMRGFL